MPQRAGAGRWRRAFRKAGAGCPGADPARRFPPPLPATPQLAPGRPQAGNQQDRDAIRSLEALAKLLPDRSSACARLLPEHSSPHCWPPARQR